MPTASQSWQSRVGCISKNNFDVFSHWLSYPLSCLDLRGYWLSFHFLGSSIAFILCAIYTFHFLEVAMSDKPQLIEQTSKRIKAAIIVGYLLLFVGLPFFIKNTFFCPFEEMHQQYDFVSATFFISGISIIATAKFLAWWHHG